MGCGNFVSVFSEDPQDMPGQGLARTDNYRATTANGEYLALLKSYLEGLSPALQAEQDYGPKFAEARLKTLDRTLTGTSDTPGVSKMYLDALRFADPESANLFDSLTSTATNELALDNQLDPNQLRTVEQAGRASAAARGMGNGPSDAFAETFAKLGMGEQLRDKRRGNALNIAQLRQLLAAKPADMAMSAALRDNPNLTSSDQMFSTLNSVYGQNQQNNRSQAELETKIGMDEANKWNQWGSFAAGAI